MAFTWEVEALRKMIQATIAGTAAEHNILQDAAKEEWGEYLEERFGEYPEPDDDFVPEDTVDLIRKNLNLKADDPLPDHYRTDRWGNVFDKNIRKEMEQRALSEEEGPPWEGIPFQEYYEGLRAEEEWQQDMQDTMRDDYIEEKQGKLKLDWVNEILQEFQEDKAPEVLRLPQWKDEEKKPDMSPFLSYLLRQSPYSRLPAAGLLGLGLMGYSKPAY